MGSRTQFAGFSNLTQGGSSTLLNQQEVEALFNKYVPKDSTIEPASYSNESVQGTVTVSHQDSDAAAAGSSHSGSATFDTNTEDLFHKLKIQDAIAGRWDHMGSRFEAPEMTFSRVAPLDYYDDESLLFQVIETLPEKKMRYLIHQICRDQASAFRWFSRECLDMECEWPLIKLRTGLRQTTADEFEDAWWHNEFWERRANSGRKTGVKPENQEDVIYSPWIVDPSLSSPCSKCAPQVHEVIEAIQGHGKAHGKRKASSREASDLGQEIFICHQCGEEITKEHRAEACVFHPPFAFQRYQPVDDNDETIEEAIQRQDRDAALERLGVYEQESWGLTWSCCGESELSAGCERGRHAPEKALKYVDDMFYRSPGPVRRIRVERCGSESPGLCCGSACADCEDRHRGCGSVRGSAPSPESERDAEEKDLSASIVTAIRDKDSEAGESIDGKAG